MAEETQFKQDIGVASDGVPLSDYMRLSQILIDALPRDKKEILAGRVMIYLAEQTMEAISQGKGVPDIPTKAIYADLAGNPNQQPSQWFVRIWEEIEERRYPAIKQTLIELCHQAGLKVYPVLDKVSGRTAFYRLGTKALPNGVAHTALEEGTLPPGVIRYKRDLTPGLSWLGRVIFGKELIWTPFKRYTFLTWQMLFLLSAAAFDLLLWVLLWFSKGPLSGQELVVFAMAIALPIGAYYHFRDVFRLFYDRIAIAPDLMLAWKEFGATVEINRSRTPGEPSKILVQRYTATCPICGWMVKLEKGGPDFPGQIVGKCEEHPTEHVFSFDRSSKLGRMLRESIPQ